MPPIRLTLKDAAFYTAAGELELGDIVPTETRYRVRNRFGDSYKTFLADIAVAVRETLLYGV